MSSAILPSPVEEGKILRREGKGRVPLSYSQERLWFIDRLQGSVQYHMPWVFRVRGELDGALLERSFRMIVDRHEVLRTVIREEEGIGYQQVKATGIWKMERREVKEQAGEGDLPAAARAIIRDWVSRPFDLSADSLLRVGWIKLSQEESLLVVVMHHIASDGWSVGIMVGELMELYGSGLEGRSANLPDLPVQYGDYALWQRSYVSGGVLEHKLSYWRQKLNRVPALELPLDHSRSSEQGLHGASAELPLDLKLSEALEGLCQREEVTLFMLLLSVFKILLYRYSGQKDICVGTPVAGRQQQEVEGLIGFFINTLALRSIIKGTMTLSAFLQQIKLELLDDYEHQEAPFEKVVEALGVLRDMGRNPVFQVMFGLQHASQDGGLQLGDTVLEELGTGQRTALFDLSLDVVNRAEGLLLVLTYDSGLYEPSTATRMLDHYRNLLLSVCADPQRLIDDLVMIGEEEKEWLDQRNATEVDYAEGETIVSLFRRQVTRTPEAVAVISGHSRIKYGELDRRSDLLASYLQRQGIGRGSLVGACMQRGIELIAALLAIWKAGATYVPVDPELPPERIAYLLEDSGCKLILTLTTTLQLIQDDCRRAGEWICLDKIKDNGRQAEEWICKDDEIPASPAMAVQAGPSDAAYIIYTSGSTGKPKGVVIGQAALSNYCLSFRDYFSIGGKDSICQQSSISFDTMMEETCPALISGATILIVQQGGKDIDSIKKYIEEGKITILSTTPLVLEWLNKELQDTGALRMIISGGDLLHAGQIDRLFGRVPLVNSYGPTETTICVTYHLIKDITTASHIGRPLANMKVYVMDAGGNSVAPGIAGELYVGGPQLARGYWNREDLTAERFIYHHPEGSVPVRLYRTGDKGRWLPDGTIEYLGRLDEQVKIRGYRVEPGEIEHVLRQAPGIRQAVVLALQDGSGAGRLAAAVVTEGAFDKEKVVAYLRRQLPDYMIPVIWREWEDLPLTVSGKVDKHRLSESGELSGPESRVYEGPRTLAERSLCGIWERLLGVEQVGINDNFFERGGHSLLAMRMVSAIRTSFHREVPIRELFLYPTVRELSLRLPEAAEILVPAVLRREGKGRVPLSYSQERLWFIDRLQGSVQYHMPWVFRVRGALDGEMLERSFRMIVDRHEVLRTVIREEEGIGYQQVKAAGFWKMERRELQGEAEGAGEAGVPAAARAIIRDWVSRPFDLSADSLLRVGWIKLSQEESLLVVVMHHIASDGWSVGIMVGELMELYDSGLEGRSANLPDLPVQYGDYALWQRSYVSGGVLEHKLSYWRQKLNGVPALELPLDHSRSSEQGLHGASAELSLDLKLSEALEGLCQREEVTLFMLLLSVFKILLYRYSGQKDICVGTPVAGRQQQEVEGLIGFFINTLALRSQVQGTVTFGELLQQVRQTTLEAYEHQEAPFEKVVEALGVLRNMGRNPVFQVMFGLQHASQDGGLQLGDTVLEEIDTGQRTALFDLSLDVVNRAEGILLVLTYDSGLYESSTAVRMLDHYRNLLLSICANPQRLIDDLVMIGEEEKEWLDQRNATEVDYAEGETIVSLFRRQVARTPEAVAVISGHSRIKYGELDRRSDLLASYLQRQGVGPDSLVPVCLDRSPEMIIGILGVMKTGAAYVPIDPEYPIDRIAYMLEDISATIAVSTSSCRHKLEQHSSMTIVELDEQNHWLPEAADRVALPGPKPFYLAYVIYTSGSTGRPKGVMVEHRSVVNRLQWGQDYYRLEAGEPVLNKTTFCFDVSVWEIFWPLISGGRLILAEPGGQKDVDYVRKTIEYYGITTVHFVPSMLDVFLEGIGEKDCPGLKRVLCSGEALKPGLCVLFRKKLGHVALYNLYGPTEASIEVSFWKVPEDLSERDTVPIGRPIANTLLYVMDQRCKLAPRGGQGEIYIGGVQVSRGYWNREDLTAERFIYHHPEGSVPVRLYRTGDKGRWLPDGTIEYLGRLDEQVKIRGYRVEPGEIEHVLRQAPGIRQAVVLALQDGSGAGRLAAAVVTEGAFDKEKVVAYLRRQLPDYMIPVIWREWEDLPLTVSGKVDKHRLSESGELSGPESRVYEGPRTLAERSLCGIWERLLGVEQVGINDNFFERGGHSLLAMRMVSAIRTSFHREVPIRELFLYPTVRELSLRLPEAAEILVPAVLRREGKGRVPLSYSQERLWFIDRLQGSVQYHMPWVFRVRGALDGEMLERSFRMIVDRHEVLRTVIREEEGIGYQQVKAAGFWKMERRELQGEAERAGEAEGAGEAGVPAAARAIIRDWVSRPFDLSADSLLRVGWIKLSQEESLLVVVMHHIASDGWSVGIMVGELMELYDSGLEGRSANLPDLPVQYGDYALWQRSYVSGGVLEHKLSYWRQKLNGVPALELPLDHSRSSEQGLHGASAELSLDLKLSEALEGLCQREEVTLFMLLLSVFKILLYRYSGQKDICVGTPVAGRQQQEVEGLIGFFINTLALRSQVQGTVTFGELLQQVRQTTLEAYEHQEAPFEKVVEALGVLRNMGRNPVFQVMFGLQHASQDGGLQLGDTVLEEIDTGQRTALFDLSLDVVNRAEGILLVLTYDSGLYESSTAVRMLDHYRNLLTSICANPQRLIDDLVMMHEDDDARLFRKQMAAGRQRIRPVLPGGETAILKAKPETAAIYVPPATEMEHTLFLIWSKLLNHTRIGVDDNFFELGGHSIIMLRLLNSMKKYRQTVTLRDLFQCTTIKQQAALLLEKDIKVNRLSEDRWPDHAADGHLLLLQGKGEGIPIFVMPGSDGFCDSYESLSRCFKDICPVYGIQMAGFFPGEQPLNSICEIAALNVRWIRQVQTKGPYRFIGHSFGAHVAFEMCKQLENEGESIEWVAILDMPSELKGNELTDRDNVALITDLASDVFEIVAGYKRSQPARMIQLKKDLSVMMDIDEMLAYIPIYIKNNRGDSEGDIQFLSRLLNLRTKNLLIRHTVIGEVRADLVIARARDENRPGYDEFLGWTRHAENISSLSLPGDHLNMSKEKNATVLKDFLLNRYFLG